MFKLAPSVLSADLGNLSQEVQRLYDAGCRWVHFDVMDGQFVPPITFGANVLKWVKKPQDMVFDCHLMVERPENQIAAFAEAGADFLSIHAEATPHLQRLLQQIRAHGMKAAVALNPATPLSVLDYVYNDLDLILLMSVNPGWGGQSYVPAVTQKIKTLRSELNRRCLSTEIQVDGGVNERTIAEVIAAGASNVVVGNAMFQGDRTTENYRERMKHLYACVENLK